MASRRRVSANSTPWFPRVSVAGARALGARLRAMGRAERTAVHWKAPEWVFTVRLRTGRSPGLLIDVERVSMRHDGPRRVLWGTFEAPGVLEWSNDPSGAAIALFDALAVAGVGDGPVTDAPDLEPRWHVQPRSRVPYTDTLRDRDERAARCLLP